MSTLRPVATALAVALALAATPSHARDLETERATVRVTEVAQGLEHPWGFEFLPDARIIVTERPGRVRLVATDGTLSPPLGGVPRVRAQGQGGMLDVALDPDFASNARVWLCFSEPGGEGASTALGHGRLDDNTLRDFTVVYSQQPKTSGNLHFGCRIVFDDGDHVFLALGDRFRRDEVQDLANDFGKVIRLKRDGSIPADNPHVGRDGARPGIWSHGHRNIQGAAWNPERRELWTVEHGARGGDEINAPQAGLNYGWPVITYGRDYSFLRIGEGTAKPGLEQPLHYWDPSIAPSGMAFHHGGNVAIPEWRGNLFIGGLKEQRLSRLELDGQRIVHEERIDIAGNQRIRDVVMGPDGHLYVATDSPDGRILKIEPVR
jgi:glucose/arabinose dehydrogenase